MEAREHVVSRRQRRKVELESLGRMNRAVVAGSLHTQHQHLAWLCLFSLLGKRMMSKFSLCHLP